MVDHPSNRGTPCRTPLNHPRTLTSPGNPLKWNATVTMNRAPMINQNITFHLRKYNSNMFCVLKVITDKLTLLCLTMYSAIFLQSLLWDLNQMTSDVHTRFPGGLHHKHHARGRREGGREGGQKEILPEGEIDQMYWSQWRWGIEEGAGGRGRAEQRGGRKFYLGGRIDQMYWSQWRRGIEEGAVERGGRGRDGWKGGEGHGRRGGRKFYLGGAGFPAGFPLLGGSWRTLEGSSLGRLGVKNKVSKIFWGSNWFFGRSLPPPKKNGPAGNPVGGIDQMHWSKWRWGIEEGVHLQTWGSGAPYPLFHRLWGRGREGGRREGGYRLIISVSWLSTTETHALGTSHFRWPG